MKPYWKLNDKQGHPQVELAPPPPRNIASRGESGASRTTRWPGIAPAANGLWMSQIARNLTDSEDGILIGKRYLIHTTVTRCC
jgi:hypothetical protein